MKIELLKSQKEQVGESSRICWTDTENKYRFLLGQPHIIGDNILFIGVNPKNDNVLWIGANPSTADLALNDMTVKKIIRFTQKISEGAGWLLMNVYPHRATNPNDLPSGVNEQAEALNISVMRDVFVQYNITKVVGCWGNLVLDFPVLTTCKDRLLAQLPVAEYYHLGELTQRGEPKHPSRLGYDTPLNKLVINN
jgi:hypothetical protein